MSFLGAITAATRAFKIHLGPGLRANFREFVNENENFKLLEKAFGSGPLLVLGSGCVLLVKGIYVLFQTVGKPDTPTAIKSLEATLERESSAMRKELGNISAAVTIISKKEEMPSSTGSLEDFFEGMITVTGPLDDFTTSEIMAELYRRMNNSKKAQMVMEKESKDL